MTTKVQALDHLTDALAGEDVVGESTVAGAIDKLAMMIEGGEISIGGGSRAIKMGVLRPDAELVQTWAYDKYVVEEEEITLPSSVGSSAKTLIAGANITPTITLDYDNYDYYVIMRSLVMPVYDGVPSNVAKQEFHSLAALWEFENIPPNTITAKDGRKYANRFTDAPVRSYNQLYVYTNSGGTLAVNSGGYVGVYATSPNVTLNSTTLKLTSPSLSVKIDSGYFPEEQWGYVTDIRRQYIFELYRAPIGGNVDGWGLKSQKMHIFECAKSSSGKLT